MIPRNDGGRDDIDTWPGEQMNIPIVSRKAYNRVVKLLNHAEKEIASWKERSDSQQKESNKLAREVDKLNMELNRKQRKAYIEGIEDGKEKSAERIEQLIRQIDDSVRVNNDLREFIRNNISQTEAAGE